jgi:putative flippase GtrA
MKLPAVIREINVFVLVGVLATACQVGVSLAAQRWIGLEAMAASLTGYAASVGVSYLGNSRFTFRRPALHAPQFAKFATISLTGLALNLSLVFVCTHNLAWPLWQAMIPVVLIVPPSSFLMSKLWAFRAAEPEAVG